MAILDQSKTVSPDESFPDRELELLRCKLKSNLNDEFLKLFLLCSNHDIEKTYRRIKRYLYAISQRPDLFQWNRDSRKVFASKIVAFSKFKDGIVRLYYQSPNWDPQNVKVEEIICAIMKLPLFDSENSLQTKTCHLIVNLSALTFYQLSHFGIANGLFLGHILNCGLPVKVTKVHIIFQSRFFRFIYNTSISPFLARKIAARIVLHENDLEELYSCCPKECLPGDLGGFGEWQFGAEDYESEFEKRRTVFESVWKQPKLGN